MITSSNIGNSTLSNVLIAKLRDYAILTKYRLNLTVVFSSVIGYLYAYGSNFQLVNIWWLSLAGFLVTGSANGINQVLEKDYDKLMKRTADGRIHIAAKRRELTVYFHVVGQPIPVTAVTSPQAMIAPLKVVVALPPQ